MSDLGKELVRLREFLGISQDALAKAIGHTTASTLSVWENGLRVPSEGNLRRLAEALGTTVEHLHAHGGPYNPNAPRRTKRQRAAASKMPLVKGDEDVQAFLQYAQTFLAARQATGAEVPKEITDQLDALLLESQGDLPTYFGPDGMVVVWKVAAKIQQRPEMKSVILSRIEGVLDHLNNNHEHAPPQRKHA